MNSLTRTSPCVMQLIKDVLSVYEQREDGSGRSDGISVYFLEGDQKFVVTQTTSFLMPEDDGGTYLESDTLWEESYSWNEMTSWYFSNRPFSYEEFLIYNEAAIKAAYIRSMGNEELSTNCETVECFANLLFNNPHLAELLGETVGLCHAELGHKLF